MELRLGGKALRYGVQMGVLSLISASWEREHRARSFCLMEFDNTSLIMITNAIESEEHDLIAGPGDQIMIKYCNALLEQI